MRYHKTLRGIIAGSLLLGSVAITAAPVMADDDDDRFGTYLYSGTVEGIDDAEVVDDIGELESDDDDDRAKAWNLLGNGQEMPSEFYFENEDSDDDGDITLDELLAEPHLIVVHEDEGRNSPIIAMGVIEGEVADDGSLLIQLEEHEGSGFEGRAWFGPESLIDDDDDDDDGNDFEVVVGIYPTGEVEPLGTAEALG